MVRFPDTVRNIPIPEKEKNLCFFIFNQINQYWKDNKKTYPPNTIVQKILVATADKLDLPITRAWYLYGKTAIQNYLPRGYQADEEKIRKKDIIVKTVNGFCKRYIKLNSYQVKRVQYKDNPLYDAGLDLHFYLNFDFPKDLHRLPNLLTKLSFFLPIKKEYTSLNKLVIYFCSLTRQIITINEESNLKDLKPQLIQLYDQVWRRVALFHLRYTLENPNKLDIEHILSRKKLEESIEHVQDDFIPLFDYLTPKNPHEAEMKGDLREIKNIFLEMGLEQIRA